MFFKETTLSELNLHLFLTGYWPEERRRSVGIYFPRYFFSGKRGLKTGHVSDFIGTNSLTCFGRHNIVAFDAFYDNTIWNRTATL